MDSYIKVDGRRRLPGFFNELFQGRLVVRADMDWAVHDQTEAGPVDSQDAWSILAEKILQ